MNKTKKNIAYKNKSPLNYMYLTSRQGKRPYLKTNYSTGALHITLQILYAPTYYFAIFFIDKHAHINKLKVEPSTRLHNFHCLINATGSRAKV